MDVEHSSYKVETAVNILRKLGLKLNEEAIKLELADPSGFYRTLVRLPAQILKNSLVLQQTEDMQAYVQNRLVNIVFANYVVSMKQGKGEEEQDSESLSSLTLTEMQNEFEKQADLLAKYKEEYNSQSHETDAFSRAKLIEWQDLQKSGTKNDFTSQFNNQINAKMLNILEKYAQYRRVLQSTFNLDQKVSIYTTKFPDPQREREIEHADKVEKPEIEFVQEQPK